MCIDYMFLNKVKLNNRYPIPCINGLFYKLQGATIFFKIDLRSDYHQLMIQDEEI